MSRRIVLTPELVARVHREVPDAGPQIHRGPDMAPMDEADYHALADRLLAEHRAHRDNGAGELWIFAYGALIWRPACARYSAAAAGCRVSSRQRAPTA